MYNVDVMRLHKTSYKIFDELIRSHYKSTKPVFNPLFNKYFSVKKKYYEILVKKIGENNISILI